MTDVLIVAGTVPRQEAVLLDALRRFREQGVRVRMVLDFPLDRLPVDPALGERFGLRETAPDDRLRKSLSEVEPTRALWLRAWREPVVRRWVREADVLISLDMRAIYAVWEMAQRQPHADACHGLGPGTKAVRARLAGDRPSHRTGLGHLVATRAGIVIRGVRRRAMTRARRIMRVGMAPPVMRSGVGAWFWRSAVTAPAMPDRIRGGLAYRVHQRSVEADQLELAAAASVTAAARMTDRRARTQLLTRQATWAVKVGRLPVCLAEAVEAELAVADELLSKHNTAKAAASVCRALRLLFHRVVHFEQARSPLVEHPTAFLAPLRGSAAGRALTVRRGRTCPADGRPTNRPLRLLLLTNGNDHLVRAVRQRYAGLAEVEIRYVDLTDESAPVRGDVGALVSHRLAGQSEYGNRAREWLQPQLEWADTLFVDGSEAASIVTAVDPGDTRVVVRLHGVDLLTPWPQLIDYSRVDELVVASAELRELATEVLPSSPADPAPTVSILGEALDLAGYARPKDPQARFTLGLLGTNAVDTRWAVELLRQLRAADARYRLLLIGPELNPELSTTVQRFHDELLDDLTDLEQAGAVIRIDQVPDVPEALTGIGVILGSLVRETAHYAVIEGAASGAVPVVRPFLAEPGREACGLVPAEWLAVTTAHATERIRNVTASEEGWRTAGELTAAHVLAAWDWSATGGRFDELLRVPVADPVR